MIWLAVGFVFLSRLFGGKLSNIAMTFAAGFLSRLFGGKLYPDSE